MTSTKEILEMK